MDKPEKRKLDKNSPYLQYDKGYNHSYDDWEFYHYTETERLNLKLYDRLDKLNRANKEIIKLRERLEKKC